VEEGRFIVSVSPHIKKKEDVAKVMIDVLFALLPALAIGVLVFGVEALWVVLTCMVGCVISEALFQKIAGKEIRVRDCSALVTGMLLGLNLPSGIPLWIAVVGAGIAIGIGKEVFGGLGQNPFNPALIGRVVLLISWPLQMTTWPTPLPWGIDAKTSATPLGVLKEKGPEGIFEYFKEIGAFAEKSDLYLDLFLGNIGGCIGEVSCLALLIGGFYLLYKGHITWHTPLSYIGTVFLLTSVFWLKDPQTYIDPLFHILSGGLMLGAFFMATDMVTSPITPKGKLIFGAGCGILTVIIRLFGGYPEGVSFAILLMNGLTPLIDRWSFTHPRRFGEKK
jgi:electron transport complex protein RnfD